MDNEKKMWLYDIKPNTEFDNQTAEKVNFAKVREILDPKTRKSFVYLSIPFADYTIIFPYCIKDINIIYICKDIFRYSFKYNFHQAAALLDLLNSNSEQILPTIIELYNSCQKLNDLNF